MRKELLTKIKHEEEAQRRWKLAAFQPQWFCDSLLERATCVCVFVCAWGNWRDEGIPGPAPGQMEGLRSAPEEITTVLYLYIGLSFPLTQPSR